MEDITRTQVLFMRAHFAPFNIYPGHHDNAAFERASHTVGHLTPQPVHGETPRMVDGRLSGGGGCMRVGEMERDVVIDLVELNRLAERFRGDCPTEVFMREQQEKRTTLQSSASKQALPWPSLPRKAIRAPKPGDHMYRRPVVLPRAKL